MVVRARAAEDELEGTGHRVKRVKTGNTVSSSNALSLKTSNMKAVDQPKSESISQASDSDASKKENPKLSEVGVVDSSEQDKISKPTQDPRSSCGVISRSGPTPIKGQPTLGIDGDPPVRTQFLDEKIDMSTAPADASQLASWVAEMICRIHREGQVPVEVHLGHDEILCRPSSHPPGLNDRNNNDGEIPVFSNFDRKKDEQRDRKRRWRSEHIEENHDNDLRCRINSRAKKLYGMNPSAEKTEFMKAEFKKRKARRISRESHQAQSPHLGLGPETVHNLFPVHDVNYLDEINAAGTLLINTLQGLRNEVDGESNLEAATVLSSALKDSTIDSRPFVEALRILSKDSNVVEAIDLMQSNDRAVDIESGLTSPTSTAASTSTGMGSRRASRSAGTPGSFSRASGIRGGAMNGSCINNHQQSNEAIKALNAATLILSEFSESSLGHYVTPYGNPPPSMGATIDAKSINGGQTAESIELNTYQASPAGPLTLHQIDAFLKFASGKSLMDNDDDGSIDVPDDATEPEIQETTLQPDIDINATLQCIIKELTADEAGGRDNLGFLLATSQADKAATLQRLFAEAGISINTIIPAAQAHATSQLYTHLSNRAHKFPASGGINPVHANAFGNTAQMTQRMLARPINFGLPLQAAPSSSRENVVGPPARGSRGKGTEEVRKVREYGFPPLPGFRPGLHQERKHT